MSSAPSREGKPLLPEEVSRYSRHLLIPEIGLEGQKRLKAASVLVVGAGGLGSPAAMYLAAAGVGTLGIADADVVDLTNLQRQLLHSTSDVGRSKADSAEETIRGINPNVKVRLIRERIDSSNAMSILPDFDVVVDGTDNFPTRYLINDACVFLGKPNVYGSVFRFDGQVSVFDPKRGGPCYRCLYPSPPPPGLVPSCAEGGVLGVLPGIIGSLQALSAIRLLVGLPEPLIGKLMVIDALGMVFRDFAISRDPACPVCGERPTIRELIDYESFCAAAGPAEAGAAAAGAAGTAAGPGKHGPGVDGPVTEITVEEFKALRDAGANVTLVDVREPQEYEIANLGGRLIPRGELASRTAELDRSADIVVHCKTGVRSAAAAKLLTSLGFRKVRNLKGGIAAWAERIDPGMTRY